MCFINFKFSFNFKLLPLEKNMVATSAWRVIFSVLLPPTPTPCRTLFQNKGGEKHNLIPCGNVMQLENREGITATLYNIKKSDGLFWFSLLEKTHWCLTLYQLSIHHTRHCRNVMCQIFIIGQCDNIFVSFCFFYLFSTCSICARWAKWGCLTRWGCWRRGFSCGGGTCLEICMPGQGLTP